MKLIEVLQQPNTGSTMDQRDMKGYMDLIVIPVIYQFSLYILVVKVIEPIASVRSIFSVGTGSVRYIVIIAQVIFLQNLVYQPAT
jgi:hypothetical protein